MHRHHSDVLQSRLFAANRLEGYLFRIVIDQMSVGKVQTVLLQIGLALGLVPTDHQLIVATFSASRKRFASKI